VLRHKRAFVLDGVMVELFFVRRDGGSLFTTFWAERHDWPSDTPADVGLLPVASAAAVAGYRVRNPQRPEHLAA